MADDTKSPPPGDAPFPSPTEEELKKADDEVAIVVLTQGETEDNRPFYAYLAIPPSKYLAFKKAEESGSYALQDYGEVIAFDYAEAPPEELQQEIEATYGVQHDFEEQLLAEIEKQQEKSRLLTKYGVKKGPETDS